MSDGQKPITTVRFPPTMAANARHIAERDGMSLSAWIRRLIEQEIGRRDGRCPTCGHDVPCTVTDREKRDTDG
jgi:hypothetical protein